MTDKSKRFWPRVLLAVSLAINLLVLGVVVGGLLSRNHGSDGRVSGRDTGMYALIVMLPPEERSALRSSLDLPGPEARGKEAPGVRQHALILAALRSEPFDADHFHSVLSDRRKDRDAWAASAENALAVSVAGLTHAERLDYAKRLDRWSRSRHRKDQGGRDKK